VSPGWRLFAKIAISVVLLSAATPVSSGNAASGQLSAGAVSPTQWPRPYGQGPSLEGWPNALRISGPDRYQTSLATVLTMRGLGGFPYDSPDPSSGGATTLGQPGSWWGLRACPRSIIVVAGDSPADALAATALSDPTDESTEPYLRRSAAADPLFDPIGGYNRVDTHTAAILLTKSSRDGAFGLSTSARIAAKDMRSGGCSTARQAVVVGGTAAVPAAVDEELVALGYSEVFRVEGLNRYQTAAKVAIALGTAAIPPNDDTCRDEGSRDGSTQMGYYANSVVEWRSSPETCLLLGNTVVLTDGIVGADAIAAGWWTSFWQVPVLLHNGRDTLPAATREALLSIGIENLIVLGGAQRISSEVAREAGELAGAKVWRIAGNDRYGTSIEMAKNLGGWWPTGRAADVSGSMLCFAASDPSGLKALGWPDALSAGPWCGAASGAGRHPRPPERALEPINGPWPAVTSTQVPQARSATPMILVPSGSKELPAATRNFLSALFPLTDQWCNADSAISGCSQPGFAVIFGGQSAVTDEIVGQISSAVAGLTLAAVPNRLPVPDQMFATKLSMSPVFHEAGIDDVSLCSRRGELQNTRWIGVGVDESERVLWDVDLLQGGWYLRDLDGVTRSSGVSVNGCLSVNSHVGSSHWVRVIDPHGRASQIRRLEIAADNWTVLDSQLEAGSPVSAIGIDSAADPVSGGETVLRFDTPATFDNVIREGETSRIISTSISLKLQRGVDGAVEAPDRFSAQWTINTYRGSLVGDAKGEAVYSNGIWALRGSTSLLSGTWEGANADGGFHADIATNGVGSQDDAIIWRIDALSRG